MNSSRSGRSVVVVVVVVVVFVAPALPAVLIDGIVRMNKCVCNTIILSSFAACYSYVSHCMLTSL